MTPCRHGSCLQDPWRSGSGPNSAFAGAAGLLQLRLLQAYLLLPKAAAFAPEHASLLRLCAAALKGTSAPSGQPSRSFTSWPARLWSWLCADCLQTRLHSTSPGSLKSISRAGAVHACPSFLAPAHTESILVNFLTATHTGNPDLTHISSGKQARHSAKAMRSKTCINFLNALVEIDQ